MQRRAKTEASTSTPNFIAQMNSESNETSTIVSVSESAFQHFFRISKIHPYAQVMSKKPTAAPNNSSLENYRHGLKINGRMDVTRTSPEKKTGGRKDDVSAGNMTSSA